MSKLGKLRKNAQSFNLKEMYSSMTPEDYRNGIRIAVENTLNKLKKEYENDLKYSTIYAIDTLSEIIINIKLIIKPESNLKKEKRKLKKCLI